MKAKREIDAKKRLIIPMMDELYLPSCIASFLSWVRGNLFVSPSKILLTVSFRLRMCLGIIVYISKTFMLLWIFEYT